jgi:hypothetical protein
MGLCAGQVACNHGEGNARPEEHPVREMSFRHLPDPGRLGGESLRFGGNRHHGRQGTAGDRSAIIRLMDLELRGWHV